MPKSTVSYIRYRLEVESDAAEDLDPTDSSIKVMRDANDIIGRLAAKLAVAESRVQPAQP